MTTITTREELVEVLARIGLMGMAREGDLDALFETAPTATPPTADTLQGATATGKAVMKATDPAAARTAIGAGTSSLTVGTSASQAKAGNYAPNLEEVQTAAATAPIASAGPVGTDKIVVIRDNKLYTVTVDQIKAYAIVPG